MQIKQRKNFTDTEALVFLCEAFYNVYPLFTLYDSYISDFLKMFSSRNFAAHSVLHNSTQVLRKMTVRFYTVYIAV
jgi:hypothetical protein